MLSKNIISTLLLTAAVTLSGCASHAKIERKALNSVSIPAMYDKTINNEVFYSQPLPGVFNGKEMQDVQPLEDVQLSVASAEVMDGIDNLLAKHKPLNTTVTDGNADYMLRVTIIANDKKGPVYGDHEFMKSVAKNMLTLGFAGSDYEIVSDFKITYELYQDNQLIHQKTQKMNDSYDHDSGFIEFNKFENVDKASRAAFEKHIGESITTFYQEAKSKIS